MPDPVRQFDLDDDSAYLPFAETSAAPIDPRDEGRNLELVSGRLTGAGLNVGVLRLDRGEGVGECDIVGTLLAVRSQRPDERVEAFDSRCRGAE